MTKNCALTCKVCGKISMNNMATYEKEVTKNNLLEKLFSEV